MALHTWGRTLNQHPHIHCLVTVGGMTAEGDWRAIPGDYLLPAQVVKAVYRGKLLERLSAALRANRLRAPQGNGVLGIESLLRGAANKRWNVRLESRYGHENGVAKYLARYVRGGPITNTRIVSAAHGYVRFRYRDHRDGKRKIRTLVAPRFVAQLLWHVTEPGQHTVRHVGLCAHASKKRRERCRQLLEPSARTPKPRRHVSWQEYLTSAGRSGATVCPRCGCALIRGATIPRRARRQNSLIRSDTINAGAGFVQRDVGGNRDGVISRRPQPIQTSVHFFGAERGTLN